MHFSNKLYYSSNQFNIIIKKEEEKFEEDISSKKWNLELEFINPGDSLLKYIFSVKYEDDRIIDIKNDLNENDYHPHKDHFCTCHRNKNEILSEDEKIELDKVSFGLISLAQLLKINIIEHIYFLKDTENTKCRRIKYLRSKLEFLI
jgi:hypothetical protein